MEDKYVWLEVSAGITGPDALYLIGVLQENDISFEISTTAPRSIKVQADRWDIEDLIEDHFKEGFIEVMDVE